MSRIVAVALLSAAFAGCGATDPADLLDTRLFVSDSTVHPLAPIDVRIETTNRSSRDVRVDSNACPRVFRIVDVDGQIVGPPTSLCALAFAQPTVLAPGASFGFTYQWAGDDRNYFALPEGEYHLRGWINHSPLGPVYSDDVRVRVVPSP
jgi:hypothetical protein